MGTVYILGAGFSKTCGIATDLEMLDSLNPMLEATETKGGGAPRTTIEYLREQNFHNQQKVGFELFMSTLSSVKFIVECMGPGRNVAQEEEQELQEALRTYLVTCVREVNWVDKGKTILDFVGRVDWKHDFILTFNYDLLLEAAAKKLDLDVGERIIHLHGAINEKALAWPTYTKFAYDTTKMPLAPQWKRAFEILCNLARQTEIGSLVFIGYSMPPSDLEAKSLFNYTDWYNSMPGHSYEGKRVPVENHYAYPIVVVNPDPEIKSNYKFFRKNPVFHQINLEKWLIAKEQHQ